MFGLMLMLTGKGSRSGLVPEQRDEILDFLLELCSTRQMRSSAITLAN